MGRLLVLAALVLVAVWLVRRALARLDAGGAPPAAQPTQDLVRCAHCGLLLPRGEAPEAGGATYCGEEHLRQGPRHARQGPRRI
jgi:uncharacterized protein